MDLFDTPVDGGSWSSIISKFDLDSKIIYMNTGTEGSMPRQVQNRLFADIKKFAKSPTYSSLNDEDFSAGQYKNRAIVAEFMGADEGEIVMANNTTMGMGVVLQGLGFGEGDEIITTRHDHLSGTSSMHLLEDNHDVTITELILTSPAPSKEEIVQIFADAITPTTKMLCFCHVNYTTGLRMPVKELCQLARDNDLMSLVDGAHSLGMVDIDLHDMGCDFYACAGHKWLNGPPGTGVLYIRSEQSTNPWTGAPVYDDDGNPVINYNPCGLLPIYSEMYDLTKPLYPGGPTIFTIPLALQVRGQCNTPAFSGMVEAMNFQETVGKAKIEERILTLSDYMKNKIAAEWGDTNLFSPAPGNDELNSGLISFVPSADSAKRYDKAFVTGVVENLKDEHQVWFRYTSFYDTAADLPGRYSRGRSTYVIRISTHIFNSTAQIDDAFDALVQVATALSA